MSWLPARRLPFVLGLAILLGAVLALGFLPLCRTIQTLAPDVPLWAIFPFLALALCLTIENPWGTYQKVTDTFWSWPVAVLIAVGYGCAQGGPNLATLWKSAEGRQVLLWFLIGIPLGEELLFRGWVRSIFHRLFPATSLTPTNPLPVAVWGGALAFSLWHVQTGNWFQVAYTVVTGLWLGYLREETGLIAAPIAAHAALNSAALLC